MRYPIESSDAASLIAIVQEMHHNFQLVSIDGWMGSGKTWMGKYLSKHLGFNPIDLDQFRITNASSYVQDLDYQRLMYHLDNSDLKVAISGICVQKVLEKLEHRSCLKLYIKRVGANGLWYEEVYEPSDCECYRSIALEATGSGEVAALDLEVCEYHVLVRPNETAHIIFKRFESDCKE